MPSDAPTLTDCIKVAYAEYARQGIDLPPVSEGVLMDIRDNDVWVAADGAHACPGRCDPVGFRGETADLMNIAVHPGAAGPGRWPGADACRADRRRGRRDIRPPS